MSISSPHEGGYVRTLTLCQSNADVGGNGTNGHHRQHAKLTATGHALLTWTMRHMENTWDAEYDENSTNRLLALSSPYRETVIEPGGEKHTSYTWRGWAIVFAPLHKDGLAYASAYNTRTAGAAGVNDWALAVNTPIAWPQPEVATAWHENMTPTALDKTLHALQKAPFGAHRSDWADMPALLTNSLNREAGEDFWDIFSGLTRDGMSPRAAVHAAEHLAKIG